MKRRLSRWSTKRGVFEQLERRDLLIVLPAASLGDFVWEDLNGNGLQDAGEPGIEDVTVNLLDADGNVIDTTMTDGDGFYEFTDVAPGTYSVQFVAPDDFVFTKQTGVLTDGDNSDADSDGKTVQFTVQSGDTIDYVDAGLKRVADLQIIKTSGTTSAVPGGPVTFTIVVSNAGPSNVTGARIIDVFSPLLVDVSYTSTVTGTVFGNTVNGSGDIDDTVNMKVDSTITYQVSAVLSPSATGTLTNVAQVIPPPGIVDVNLENNEDSASIVIDSLIVIGPDKTNASLPWIHLVGRETGELVGRFLAFDEEYRGGVRITTGDLTGDGAPEIVAVRGRNSTPDVRIFDLEGTLLHEVRVFPESFLGGVDIAVGDVDGDGRNDLIAGMSFQGSQVVVFRNVTDPAPGSPLAFEQDKSFYPFGPSFIGGVVLAAADMGELEGTLFHPTLDGTAEIIVGNEAGMRPTVKVFDYGTLQAVRTFHPFTPSYLGGLSLDVARVNGDLIPDIIVGTSVLGGSIVEVLDGNVPTKSTILSFVAYSQDETPSYNAPVRVAGVDSNGDGWADVIVTGQGTNGTTGTIKVFEATTPAALVGQFSGNQPTPSDFANAYFVADLRTASPTPPDGGAPPSASWTNFSLPEDVNGDEKVSPLDALILINKLNLHHGIVELTGQPTGTYYPDVTQSGFVEPRDVLQVINHVNGRRGQTGGEAEADEVASSNALSVPGSGLFELPISDAGPAGTTKQHFARAPAEPTESQAVDRVFADTAHDQTDAVSALSVPKRSTGRPVEYDAEDAKNCDWDWELDLAVIAEDVMEAWEKALS